MKKIIFVITSLLLTSSCGGKSPVTSDVRANKPAAYYPAPQHYGYAPQYYYVPSNQYGYAPASNYYSNPYAMPNQYHPNYPVYDYDQTYVVPKNYGTATQVQQSSKMPDLNY